MQVHKSKCTWRYEVVSKCTLFSQAWRYTKFTEHLSELGPYYRIAWHNKFCENKNEKQTSILIFSYSLCNSGNICNEDWHESKTAYIQTKKFKILNLRHLSQLPVNNPCSPGSSAITRIWACLCVCGVGINQ